MAALVSRGPDIPVLTAALDAARGLNLVRYFDGPDELIRFVAEWTDASLVRAHLAERFVPRPGRRAVWVHAFTPSSTLRDCTEPYAVVVAPLLPAGCALMTPVPDALLDSILECS